MNFFEYEQFLTLNIFQIQTLFKFEGFLNLKYFQIWTFSILNKK
jgi:hypothetical protein